MNAVFKDNSGVKRDFLWQYDRGQTLILEDLPYEQAPEVHFSTPTYDDALITNCIYNGGTLKVAIPDAFLTEAKTITVYLYLNDKNVGETVKSLDIAVRPRKKPVDYIYSDSMYVMGLDKLITNYLDAHPEFVEDVVVDYTTVRLTDEATGIEYIVGINNNKLYFKEVT